MFTKLFRIGQIAMYMGLLCLTTSTSSAAPMIEDAHLNPTTIVLKIEALTTTQRDQIIKEMLSKPGVEIQFMCVPAGIMVISSEAGQRDQILSSVQNLVGERRMIELPQKDIVFAEQACANARNSR